MTDTPTLEQALDFIATLLQRHYADEDIARILEGYAARRPVTLRANRLLATRDEVAEALDSAGIAYEGVPWYQDAFVLDPNVRERAIWELPIYEQGKVYLQSLSSMLPPLLMGLQDGGRLDVLDMCAAPGGKTTQMAALGGGNVHITACELNAGRADKLEHNLAKQGARNVTVMRCDARKLDDFFRFDRILLDAPCSGSGTLSISDPRMPGRFTSALVENSRLRQRALLAKALKLLKPGGKLLYSTCSILPQENQNVIANALVLARRAGLGGFEMRPLQLAGMDAIPQLPCSMPEALCVCPDARYEGFFVALIERMS